VKAPDDSGAPQPGARAAIAVAGLLVLLVLVAFGSRGHGWGGGASGRSNLPLSYWDAVFSVLLVVWAAGVALTAWLYFQMRGERGSRGYDKRLHPLAAIAFLATILALALAYERWGRGHVRPLRPPQQQTATNGSVRPGAERRRAQRQEHHFNWAAAAGAAAFLLALAAVAIARERRRKRGRRLPRSVEAAEALAAVIEDTLDDLRREPDPRKAVIAAYARMERALGAHGMPREPSEAPHEYLARVLVELDASASSARRLTALFERAKFSPHLIDLAMKEEAIDALVRLRDELLRREEAEPLAAASL
jgi:hypothetical protein